MGYESKIYIVERHDASWTETGASALVIASYDLCKMGYDAQEFFGAFTKETDYGLYMPVCDADGNETMGYVYEDCYGDHLKSGELETVLSALESCEAREHYRRLPPAIAMLKAFIADKDAWGDLQVVHYGY